MKERKRERTRTRKRRLGLWQLSARAPGLVPVLTPRLLWVAQDKKNFNLALSYRLQVMESPCKTA